MNHERAVKLAYLLGNAVRAIDFGRQALGIDEASYDLEQVATSLNRTAQKIGDFYNIGTVTAMDLEEIAKTIGFRCKGGVFKEEPLKNP